MTKVRGILLVALLVGSVLFVEKAPVAIGQEVAVAGPEVAQISDLKDQLEKGLQIRRPHEFAFIARVVLGVEQGRLPLQVVMSTFQWSRKKKPAPYPFFERAMQFQAAKLGVVI